MVMDSPMIRVMLVDPVAVVAVLAHPKAAVQEPQAKVMLVALITLEMMPLVLAVVLAQLVLTVLPIKVVTAELAF